MHNYNNIKKCSFYLLSVLSVVGILIVFYFVFHVAVFDRRLFLIIAVSAIPNIILRLWMRWDAL